MNLAPDPSIRRLWAAAGTLRHFMESITSPIGDGAAVLHDLEELPLLSDQVIEPLLRQVDLSGMIQRSTGDDTASERPRRERAAQRAARGGRRREDSQDSFPTSPLEPGKTPSRRSLEPDRSGVDVRTTIEAIRAAHPDPSTFYRAADAVARASDEDTSAVREESGPSPWGLAAHRPVAPATILSPPKNVGVSFPSRSEALASMRELAIRAGGRNAIYTPLRISSESAEVVAIEQAQHGTNDIDRNREDARRFKDDRRTANKSDIPGKLYQFAHVTDRMISSKSVLSSDALLDSDELRRASLIYESPGIPPLVAPGGSERDQPYHGASESGGSQLTGLRQLVAIAAPSQRLGRTTEAGMIQPETALPRIALERMIETELGERLGELLKREARRQGIDVDGVET